MARQEGTLNLQVGHLDRSGGSEPGLVLTPGAEAATTPEERDAMARFVPLKRWGTPMDIAPAMIYLASEGASYVTGQTIRRRRRGASARKWGVDDVSRSVALVDPVEALRHE